MKPIPCMVESPFIHKRHKREDLVRYAQLACVDAMDRGFAPFASHLFYTHILPEDPASRAVGLACRDAIAVPLLRAGGVVLRYVNLGNTAGMFRECDLGFPVEEVTLRDPLWYAFQHFIDLPSTLRLTVR